jgi:hypothetical protein
MAVLTLKQLQKFVKIRNKSGYRSNMQFQSDLGTATGDWRIDTKVLGPITKFTLDGGFTGYQWDVPIKGEDMPTRMIEFGHRLALDSRSPGQKDEDWINDINLFELVKKSAVAVEIAESALDAAEYNKRKAEEAAEHEARKKRIMSRINKALV